MRSEPGEEMDLRLQSLLWGLAGGERDGDGPAVDSLAAARRAVRRRIQRHYRRRRVRNTLSSGTVAAGLFAGVHQVPDSTRAALPAAGPVAAADPGAGPGLDPSWSGQEAADPGALADDRGRLYVFTTSSAAGWVPRFTGAGPTAGPARPAPTDAMPTRPAWVDPDDRAIWAPQVARVGDRYVMYFAATSASGTKCLGAAVASSPEEDFRPLPHPLWCTPGYWSIDPYPVVDGDRLYLLWRQDDPAHVTGTIVAAELRPDGLAVAGTPVTLLVGAYRWEEGYPGNAGIGPVENPALARHPATGEWLLTWSANLWETQRYATGLAVCAGPLGPCERVSREEPWVGTTARFGGAGGLSFVTTTGGPGEGDQLFAVLHAYSGAGEAPAAPRVTWVFRVEADAGTGSGPRYRLVDAVGNHSGPVAVNGS